MTQKRERFAIAGGVAGLGCLGLIGVAAVAAATLGFSGLVFMVGAWIAHQLWDAVPALSYVQSVLLAVGLWVAGFGLRLALGLLFGGVAR